MTGATSLRSAWDGLVSTALLGTDRRPLPPPAPGPLSGFGARPDAALALLDRAAAVHAARRAGALPSSMSRRLNPAPLDQRQPCPSSVARRVEAMLAGVYPDLLPDLLRTLVERELALPPELLVALMDRTRLDPDLRALVVSAAGPILPWLAGVLPQLGWPAFTGVDPDSARERWEHGSPPERVEALRRLRAADPAGARALLRDALVGERAEHRAACLAAFAIGLSDDDEALLEAALDDRSAGVREVAAQLLDGLPSSARGARMAGRALDLVRVVRDPNGQPRLDIVLVAPVPVDWERDGVGSGPPRGTSLGVHVLHQVVAATPLRAWNPLATPADLVALAAEHELGPLLVGAWAEAAAAQHDVNWARLLIDETDAPSLVAALDHLDVLAAASRHATPDGLLSPVCLALLEAVPVPWPDQLRPRTASSLVTLFLQRRAGRHSAPLLRRLIRSVDPATLGPIAEALAELSLPPPVDGVRDDVVDLVRFRAAMVDELTAEEVP